MAMTTASGNRAFLPEETGALIVRPVIEEAVATQVAQVIQTGAHQFRFPIVAADPSAAWVAEGAEITPSDAAFGETLVAFSKLAGLTILSREIAEDTAPAAAQVVGQGLARDIARKLDTAFFGSVAAPAPDGLEDLPGVTAIDAGATYANADAFLEAQAEAEQVGATLGAYVTDPATALTLAQVKEATGSNRNLLSPDPTVPTRRTVAGLPLFVSPAVTAGTVWGIPSGRTMVVIRDDTRLEVDRSAYFASDRVGVKATLRVGFAFPHPAAVVKITTS